MHVRNTK
nr:unnamed protein product [Callosobruchus chinensis]